MFVHVQDWMPVYHPEKRMHVQGGNASTYVLHSLMPKGMISSSTMMKDRQTTRGNAGIVPRRRMIMLAHIHSVPLGKHSNIKSVISKYD